MGEGQSKPQDGDIAALHRGGKREELYDEKDDESSQFVISNNDVKLATRASPNASPAQRGSKPPKKTPKRTGSKIPRPGSSHAKNGLVATPQKSEEVPKTPAEEKPSGIPKSSSKERVSSRSSSKNHEKNSSRPERSERAGRPTSASVGNTGATRSSASQRRLRRDRSRSRDRHRSGRHSREQSRERSRGPERRTTTTRSREPSREDRDVATAPASKLERSGSRHHNKRPKEKITVRFFPKHALSKDAVSTPNSAPLRSQTMQGRVSTPQARDTSPAPPRGNRQHSKDDLALRKDLEAVRGSNAHRRVQSAAVTSSTAVDDSPIPPPPPEEDDDEDEVVMRHTPVRSNTVRGGSVRNTPEKYESKQYTPGGRIHHSSSTPMEMHDGGHSSGNEKSPARSQTFAGVVPAAGGELTVAPEDALYSIEDLLNVRPTTGSYQPAAGVKNCTKCEKKFGLMRKKHHCHYCGYVFCNDCSNYKKQYDQWIPFLKKQIRVCEACYHKPIKSIDDIQQIERELHNANIEIKHMRLELKARENRNARIERLKAAHREIQSEVQDLLKQKSEWEKHRTERDQIEYKKEQLATALESEMKRSEELYVVLKDEKKRHRMAKAQWQVEFQAVASQNSNLRHALAEMKNGNFGAAGGAGSKQYDDLVQDYDLLKARLAREEQKAADLRSELEAVKTGGSVDDKALVLTLRETESKLRDRDAEVESLKNRLQELNLRVLNNLGSKEKEELQREHDLQVKHYERELWTMQSMIENLEEKVKHLSESCEVTRKSLHKHKSNETTLSIELQQFKDIVESPAELRRRAAMYEEKEAALVKELQEMQSDLEAMAQGEDANELRVERDQLMRAYNEAKSREKDVVDRLSTTQMNLTNLNREYDELKARVASGAGSETLEQQLSDLKREILAMEQRALLMEERALNAEESQQATEEQLDATEETLRELEQEMTTVDSTLNHAYELLQKKDSELAEARDAHNKAIEDAVSAYKDLHSLQGDHDDLETTLKQLRDDLAAARTSEDQKETALMTMTRKVQTLEKEKEQLEKKWKEAASKEARLAEEVSENTAAVEATKNLLSDNQELEKKNKELQAALDALKAAGAVATVTNNGSDDDADVNTLRQQVKQKDEEIMELNSELKMLHSNGGASGSHISEREEELEKVLNASVNGVVATGEKNQQQQQAEADVKRLAKEVEDQKAEIESLNAKLASREAQMEKLALQLASGQPGGDSEAGSGDSEVEALQERLQSKTMEMLAVCKERDQMVDQMKKAANREQQLQTELVESQKLLNLLTTELEQTSKEKQQLEDDYEDKLTALNTKHAKTVKALARKVVEKKKKKDGDSPQSGIPRGPSSSNLTRSESTTSSTSSSERRKSGIPKPK